MIRGTMLMCAIVPRHTHSCNNSSSCCTIFPCWIDIHRGLLLLRLLVVELFQLVLLVVGLLWGFLLRVRHHDLRRGLVLSCCLLVGARRLGLFHNHRERRAGCIVGCLVVLPSWLRAILLLMLVVYLM